LTMETTSKFRNFQPVLFDVSQAILAVSECTAGDFTIGQLAVPKCGKLKSKSSKRQLASSAIEGWPECGV